MSDRSDARDHDPVVAPIDQDDRALVLIDEWLAGLRSGEPLVGAPPAAELVDLARRGG